MWRKVLKGRLPGPVLFALRQLAREIQVARLHHDGVRRAPRFLSADQPVKLHLASGHARKEGWINVDLFGPFADLRLDLRRPLPFPNNCANYIYAEHFFEHLELPNVTESTGWDLETVDQPSEALQFLRECRRILQPAGVLDLVVPDTEGMIDEYVARHREPQRFPWWGPKWCDTHMHRLNYLFRQGREHKYAYDEETLTRLLRSVGFCDIQRRPFDPAIDQPNHVIGSLCMTARNVIPSATVSAA